MHTCLQCNSQFIPKNKHKVNKFCSVKCYRDFQKSGKYTIPAGRTGSMVKCGQCGQDYYVKKNVIKRNSNFLCSRDCYLKFHAKKHTTVQCNTCGKDITRPNYQINKSSKYYCDDNCRSNKDKTLTCKVCGVDFCTIQYRKANNLKGFTIARPYRKTCSEKCHFEMYRTDEARKEKISIAISGERHPNYVNGCSKNERIRKTDMKETISKRDKRAIIAKFKNKCFKCGATDGLTFDHHFPFSHGGRLTDENTVVLCKSCNSSKNAKMPTKFYTKEELNKLKKMGIDHMNLFNLEIV